MYRTSTLPATLIPSLSFPACVASINEWSFKWFIAIVAPWSSVYTSVIPLIPSLSTSVATRRNLALAAKSLSAGFDYTFTVNASTILNGTSIPTVLVSSFTVHMLASPLVATIAGGDRTVSPDVAQTLDASASYDPDDTTGAPSSSSLVYQWSCSRQSSTDPCLTAAETVLTLPPTSMVLLAAGALMPTEVYLFTVVVTTGGYPSDGRIAASASVVIVADESSEESDRPSVVVTIVAAPSMILVDGYFATSGIVRLQASVTITGDYGYDVLYQWSAYASGTSSFIDLTMRTSASNSTSLVVPGGILPDGAPIQFSCEVILTPNIGADIPSITGYSSYQFQTSRPPLSPVNQPFTITPQTGGVALETMFTMSVTGFVGELEPFTYAFQQLRSDGTETIIGANTVLSSSFTSSYLPAGVITLVGYVTNRVGQQTRVIANVTVLPDPTIDDGDASCESSLVAYAANITATLLRDQRLTVNSAAALDIVRVLTDLLTASSTSGDCSARDDLYMQFPQIVTAATSSSSSDRIEQTIESISHQLSSSTNDTAIILTLDVVDMIMKQLLNGDVMNLLNNDPTNTTTSVVTTISNVLNTTTSNCTMIGRVSSSLTDVIDASLAGTIVGELTPEYDDSVVVVRGQRTSTAPSVPPSILIIGGVQVTISPEATSRDADDDSDPTNNYVDVHIIQVPSSSNIVTCYGDNSTVVDGGSIDDGNSTSTSVNNTDVPISPITSIEIHDNNGTILPVKDLIDPILINTIIPLNVHAWPHVHDGVGGDSSLQCSCNHLTEFAVLARDSNSCITYEDEKIVYGVYSIMYLVVAVLSLAQVGRMKYYTRHKCKFDLMAAEHTCIFVVAIFRTILLLFRGSWTSVDLQDTSFVAIGLLMAVPYLFEFLVFTFLVATWASVYHFAMETPGSSPFAKLKTPFIIVNTIIGCVVFGLFGAIGGVDADLANTLAITGTIIMAVLTLVMVTVYVIYGRALINTLTKTGGGAAAKSPVVRNLYYATAAFCVCFAAEAIIWVISAVVLNDLHDDAAGILAAYYGANWLSLVIVLAMFRQGVNKLSPTYGRSQTGGSHTQKSHSGTGAKHKNSSSKHKLRDDDGNNSSRNGGSSGGHATGSSIGEGDVELAEMHYK